MVVRCSCHMAHHMRCPCWSEDRATLERYRTALVAIMGEQIVTGQPLREMRELENQLTASLRNIAIEALEGTWPGELMPSHECPHRNTLANRCLDCGSSCD